MAGPLLRLSLSTCCVLLLLLPQLAARPSKFGPCQRTNPIGWLNFRHKHLVPQTPKTLDQNVWARFIPNNPALCDRSVQSFLDPREERQVMAVCSTRGGKVYQGNLCISNRKFTFITVRSSWNTGTCMITDVYKETKHLILACDKVDNQCLPVHFEANLNYAKPNNNARSCGAQNTWG